MTDWEKEIRNYLTPVLSCEGCVNGVIYLIKKISEKAYQDGVTDSYEDGYTQGRNSIFLENPNL